MEPAVTAVTAAPLACAEARFPRFVAELRELVSIPSVGSDARFAGETRRCARWLAGHLRTIGFADVRLLPTAGPPLVFAASAAVPGRPVVLVYGHYDVQPPGPRAAWRTPPFEPAIRGPWLLGRGAADDKGQLFVHLKACEAWLRCGGLPVGVKVLLEGEEESGSSSLAEACRAHRDLLAADVVLASDSPMLGLGRPVLTSALRGTVTLQLELRTAAADLHPGVFGGAIADPVQIVCRAVASLRDGSGRVTVPGYHAGLRPLASAERRALAEAGPTDAQLLADARSEVPWGEPEFTLFERTTVRPALTVTRIEPGDSAGDRGALAGRATAHLDVRLAAEQDPEQVARALARHLSRHVPSSVPAAVRVGRTVPGWRLSERQPAVRAARNACRRAFGVDPPLLPTGGSIPAIPILERALGTPAVLLGFALPDDGKHGPNERFHLPTFRRAIAASILFLGELALARPLPERRRAPDARSEVIA